jgi:hypothetical protein
MGRITKQEAQKFLSDVPEEYVFRCYDGRIINNLKELQTTLATMSDETYCYHSNAEKEDFSNWVLDIIGDQKLAKDLSNAKNRSKALTVVDRRVAFLREEFSNNEKDHIQEGNKS